jgi:hypothetical protein
MGWVWTGLDAAAAPSASAHTPPPRPLISSTQPLPTPPPSKNTDTPQYPDEPPCLKPRSVRGLSDADMQQAAAAMDAVVQENMGMAMIYQVVSAAQEWLANRLTQAAAPDPETDRKRQEREEEARHAALRAHGQPVTLESFAEWKAKFDAEAALAKASVSAAADGAGGKGGGAGAAGAAGGGGEQRLTGKAWFMKHYAAGEEDVEEGEEDAEEGEEEGEEGEETGPVEEGEEGDEEEDESDEDYSESEEDEEMLASYLAAKAK